MNKEKFKFVPLTHISNVKTYVEAEPIVMITLDEAIKSAEDVAKEKEIEAHRFYNTKAYEESRDCIWCSEEYKQLADWLKQLKRVHEIIKSWKYSDIEEHDTVGAFLKICEVVDE